MQPCHNGIHVKALAEYFKMNTNVTGFKMIIKLLKKIFLLSKVAMGGERVKMKKTVQGLFPLPGLKRAPWLKSWAFKALTELDDGVSSAIKTCS